MLIVNEVLFFPFKAILKVFQEIYNAAVQEMAAESDAIRAELSQLYLALEAGSLSESAFDSRESELLDRLDAIEERGLLEHADDEESEEEGELFDDEEEVASEHVEWTIQPKF